MTVSISTIAERALQARLNVAVVPLDDRPTLTEMVPVWQRSRRWAPSLASSPRTKRHPPPIRRWRSTRLPRFTPPSMPKDWSTVGRHRRAARAFVEEFVKLVAAAASHPASARPPIQLVIPRACSKAGCGEVSWASPHMIIAVEAVMAVHNDLVAKGARALGVNRIFPDMAALGYEQCSAAYDLAPKFPPAEQDKAEFAQAMSALFKITCTPHVRVSRSWSKYF